MRGSQNSEACREKRERRDPLKGQFATLRNDEYEINIRHSGWYVVTVKVLVELEQMGSCDVELRVNGECVQSDSVSVNISRMVRHLRSQSTSFRVTD